MYCGIGIDVQLYVVLTSVLDVGEWSASCPDLFTPGKKPSLRIG